MPSVARHFSILLMPARKKATVFSTNSNRSTRENIANVFGAKALNSLVALDLKLELQASSGSSQRLSSQGDGGYVRLGSLDMSSILTLRKV